MKATTFQSIKQLATQVHRLLEKGNVTRDSPFQMKEIMLSMRQLSLKFLRQQLFENLASSTSKIVPSHYVATYSNLEIQTDADREYINIPTQYLSVNTSMGDDEGIQRVIPNSRVAIERRMMIPVPRNFHDLMGESIATFMENQWTYEVYRDKIYFNKKRGKKLSQLSIKTVNVDIVVISPEDVGDDDAFPLPPEHHFDLIVQTLQLYGVSDQNAKDLLSNQNPDD